MKILMRNDENKRICENIICPSVAADHFGLTDAAVYIQLVFRSFRLFGIMRTIESDGNGIFSMIPQFSKSIMI